MNAEKNIDYMGMYGDVSSSIADGFPSIAVGQKRSHFAAFKYESGSSDGDNNGTTTGSHSGSSPTNFSSSSNQFSDVPMTLFNIPLPSAQLTGSGPYLTNGSAQYIPVNIPNPSYAANPSFKKPRKRSETASALLGANGTPKAHGNPSTGNSSSKIVVSRTRKPLPTRDNTTKTLYFADFPDFRPNLTPKEVLQMGSFGGTYFR